MVDDMGWQDTSLPFWDQETDFNRIYQTPNMEKLASRGAKFTQAYSTPVCTPTRVSLMTGMNAARHHVTNWTFIKKDTDSGKKDSLFKKLDWNINGMSPVPETDKTALATPLPALLKDAGYYTIHVGKAHWGSMGTPASDPKNMGFIINIGGSAAGHPQSYYGEQNYGNIPGKATFNAVPDMESYYESDVFLTDALTREALKALANPIKKKDPFFLYLSHYALHTPIQGDPKYLQKYLDKGMDEREAKYATLIEGMDKSLGDVMDFLDENNLTNNTLIIFMSDNGGLSLSPERGGVAHTRNLPLRSGKGSVYEGGIREPMIMSWPGKINAGMEEKTPVIIEDFFPTILNVAGVKSPKMMQTIDGKDIFESIKNQSERAFLWHYPHHWGHTGPGINFASAMRKGDWKLVYLMKEQKLELYNLKEDIGEQNDLAGKMPVKAKGLATEMTQLMKERKAQMPVYEADGRAVLWPVEVILLK